MFNWNSLLDEAALESVLPGDYARFARPIRDGLVVFFEGLPAAHQTEILTQQAELPPSASISRRLALLAQCCPVLHKLGQILARDQRLAPELREHLRPLESLPPTVSEASIRQLLVRELGPLERRGIELAPPAIAEASVAVVIPFIRTAGGSCHKRRGGVLKVLKPGIEERLELELELLGRVGAHLDQRCESLGIPRLDYEEAFQQIREKLKSEIRLDQEQRHLTQAAEFYAGEPRIHIPALLEYCTPRVTAMERINGVKITDHSLHARHDRRRLAELVVRALIARPIFSRSRQAMFHSDPHAGNLFLTDENRLAILDWSLVGSLEDGHRIAIVQILQGALTLDAACIVGILESLSQRQPIDQPALMATVQGRLRQIRQGTMPGLGWLVGMLDEAVQTARLRVAADLMLFRKSLHTLEGVVAELGAGRFQIDDVLLADFAGHFAAEWPWRWVTPPYSREFSTRLSNADLMQTLWSYPSAVARFWLGQSLDLLDACRPVDKLNGSEHSCRNPEAGVTHDVADR